MHSGQKGDFPNGVPFFFVSDIHIRQDISNESGRFPLVNRRQGVMRKEGKKMKRKVGSVIIAMAAFLGIFPLRVCAASTEPGRVLINRQNIVFVTDESGSMKHTDPNNDRYEAIRLFLGAMTNEGNYVGSVSFGEGIEDYSEVRPLNGQREKDALLADISDQQYSDYTNIGMGLMRAVDLLENGRNTELQSAIILLTDGNTDMPAKDTLQESYKLKAEAIDRAREQGYRIYVICLNVNGAADTGEMRQIADGTGGELAEVDNSKGLNDVELMLHQLIFRSFEDEKFSDLDLTIGADGTVSTEFMVQNIGVEEINVLFSGKLASCCLIDPSAFEHRSDDSSEIVISGSGYLMMKVPKPVGGTWRAIAYGDPNTTIKLRLLCNSDFYIAAELMGTAEVQIGDTVEILAHVCTAEGIVEDISRYSDVKCEAHVMHAGEESVEPMQLTQDGFLYRMNISEEGTYYISVSAANNKMQAVADETFEISVNNKAPVATGVELTGHANIWPFIGGRASVDLSAGAEDPEGQPLVFEVKSTAFNEEDYKLEDGKLTVSSFSIPKGSFEMIAKDPFGAYCTFSVLFTSTNIGLIMGILALAGVLIAVLAVILGIRAALGKSLTGTLSVSSYSAARRGPSVPSVMNSGRGRIPLGLFAVDQTALPKGCYFQCDGAKMQVWFVSKQPVYSDTAVGASKKIRIQHKIDAHICGDEKMENGIVVRFVSDKDDPLGF